MRSPRGDGQGRCRQKAVPSQHPQPCSQGHFLLGFSLELAGYRKRPCHAGGARERGEGRGDEHLSVYKL